MFSIEASRRLVKTYDFIITSGGIGPTHDGSYISVVEAKLTVFTDITYASLAKAFDQELVHDPETLSRMSEMNKTRHWSSTQTPEQRTARERMALFPNKAEVLFVSKDIWVVSLIFEFGRLFSFFLQPVIRLEGKLCVFPGIPTLFQRMLEALTPFIPLPPAEERPFRHQIFTTSVHCSRNKRMY